MRLHGLLMLRDEGDVIAQTLSHLCDHFDAVHVLDTGSTDDSWDVVQQCARSDTRIKPFAQVQRSGNVGLRAFMFETARARGDFATGDWIARLDADEFYYVSPRTFLQSRVARREGRVFAQHYEFVVLRSELEQWERDAAEGRELPVPANIQEARTNYLIDRSMWFEARLFRYRPGMRWHVDHPNPFNPGLTAVAKIPVLHYRWRTLQQMQRRCALRLAQSKLDPHGAHWKHSDYRAWAVADDEPRLRTWSPSLARSGACEPLPDPLDPPELRHLEWPAKRRCQTLLYRSGLVNLLDRFRKGSNDLRLIGLQA